MGSRNYLKYVAYFIFYLALQVLIFRNIVLFDASFAFVYLAFILLLPLETGVNTLMLLSFFMGITVDIFYDSLGIHAAAMVLISFTRNRWLKVVVPRGGFEQGYELNIPDYGLQWFITYAFPLIFIHHLCLFAIEAGGFGEVILILKNTLFSSILTTILIVSIQLLISQKKRTF